MFFKYLMFVSILLSAISAFPQTEKSDFKHDTVVIVNKNYIKNIDYNYQTRIKRFCYGKSIILTMDDQHNFLKKPELYSSNSQNFTASYAFRTKKLEWTIGLGFSQWKNTVLKQSSKTDTIKTQEQKIDTVGKFMQFINGAFVPFYVLDTTIINKSKIQTTTNKNNSIQKSYWLSIPISASYIIRYHRFEILPQIQLIANICIKDNGTIITYNVAPEYISTGIALNLRYYIDNKLSIGTYLNHQQNLTSFFKYNDWKNLTGGLGFSLRYLL